MPFSVNLYSKRQFCDFKGRQKWCLEESTRKHHSISMHLSSKRFVVFSVQCVSLPKDTSSHKFSDHCTECRCQCLHVISSYVALSQCCSCWCELTSKNWSMICYHDIKISEWRFAGCIGIRCYRFSHFSYLLLHISKAKTSLLGGRRTNSRPHHSWWS